MSISSSPHLGRGTLGAGWLPARPGVLHVNVPLVLVALLSLLPGCDRSEGQSGQGAQTPSASAAPTASGPQEPLPPPGHAWVIFGADTVTAEVARTPEERERGLMYRESLPDGQGMLFVFPDSQVRSFWMRNTFIPLDIAYMDDNLRIINIESMEPQTDATHPSDGPAMFALEVPQGWFEKEGIEAGATAQLVFGLG